MVIGFYGKLPSHGDFVSRSVADAFIDGWDRWLQASISQSQRDLGEGWLDLFLTSPVWRFAFAGGVVGTTAYAGVLLPSVDRVGRYFPLTIVAELPAGALPQVVSVAAGGWYDLVESVARRALEQDVLDLGTLQKELHSSEQTLPADRLSGAALAVAGGFPGNGALWRFGADAEADMGYFHARLAAALAGESLAPLALWWSVGSEHVAPSVLLTRGLPPAATFRDFLRGEWNCAWQREVEAGPDDVLRRLAPPHRCESAAVSDVGRERGENQDAFVERPQEGFWLVADGMGGHQSGGFASQLIAQATSAIELPGDVATMANACAQALQNANAQLRQRAAAEPGFDAGSTVVALCLREEAGIVAWAGDSRLYRLRESALEQLTRDHNVANESPGSATAEDAHVITRAVGGTTVLDLDQQRFAVREGDRFLLCSDGLYAELTEREIAESLADGDCAAAAHSLVTRALDRGGKDNITVIVVAVSP
ncbi:MAG: type VI secretion system-associated protein TagF [Gammaproteobacteria bacterium]|nr:type VI secretion system-associated protein TagF [Gammaproteobacteria bacterium]